MPTNNATEIAVSLQVLVALLLVCLGLLLGATWTTQILQHKHRRLAEERRRLNEEWRAIRAARQQSPERQRPAGPQAEVVWFVEREQDPPDDD